MTKFNISIEIDLEANSPLEAAKELKKWFDGGWEFQAYVQNDETKELFSVDLQEDDEDTTLPCETYEPIIVMK